MAALSVVQALFAWLTASPLEDSTSRQVADFRAVQGLLVWLGGAALAGAAFPHRRLGAYVGVVAAAFAHRALMDGRADTAPREWGGLGDIILNIVVLIYVAIAALLIVLGSYIGARVARRFGRRPVATRLRTIVAAAGLGAFAATWAIALSIPDYQSFAMRVPPAWQVLDAPGRFDWEPAYGHEFTAVLGARRMPSAEQPPETPVVGVSVAVGRTDPIGPDDCYHAFQDWGATSTLFRADLGRFGATMLPAGRAYELVRHPEGLTHYSFALGRVRHIGYDARPLCYIVVVTVPDGWPMADADARAIAEGFSFR